MSAPMLEAKPTTKFYEHVVFDLDDTLLDTSGGLIPAAARRACGAMLDAGLPGTVDAALQLRLKLLNENPRATVWISIAKALAPKDMAHSKVEAWAEIGQRSFFTHPIEKLPPGTLRLATGAADALHFARHAGFAKLHLVTSGDENTQRKKLEHLGLAESFDSTHFVAAKEGAKHVAFKSIAERFRDVPPAAFLSIGNRVDTDLGEAKLLGWRTAWVRYGEHASLVPQKACEIPDFEVPAIGDLLAIWRQQFQIQEGESCRRLPS